jgi:hypothetical protein
MHKFLPLLYSYILAPTCFGSSLGYVKLQPDIGLRRIQKLPEDGRLLPKHVGANIYTNKAVVQICVLCWLFLLSEELIYPAEYLLV